MSSSHKASLGSILTLYLLGMMQGIGFTTIPAAANFLTSHQGFGFSRYEYGNLFILMIFGSIFASFFGGILAKRWGSKAILLAAVVFNIVSMLIFCLEAPFIHDINISYPLLLLCMFFLGSGFGAILTTLNSYAFHFFPNKPDTALTALHSCLGIGTAIGSLLFTFFYKMGQWWQDPLSITIGFGVLLICAIIFFPKGLYTRASSKQSHASFSSPLFWTFACIALIYGICETTFGNWGTIFLHTEKQVSLADANYALALFWGAITAGRVCITFLTFVLSSKKIYFSLSPIILISLLLIYIAQTPSSAIFAFLIAGIGCSGFLPLTFSFAQESFPFLAQVISGLMTGAYMIGYGVSSWGIGSLEKNYHLSFLSIFSWLSLFVVAMGILSAISCLKKKKSRSAR
jgi:MFS family permease